MIKTLSQALRMDKERFKVPRSVQQAIPIQRIWPDGIFQQGTKFSKTFRFTDINYYIASKDNKTEMFLDYSELLNSLDSGISAKITINNRRINKEEFEKSILLPMKEDGLDHYREEYNEMLLSKITGTNNSIYQERYLTVSVHKKSIDEARTYFARIGTDIVTHLAKLSSTAEGLDAGDIEEVYLDLISDPQTSGGLLVSVPREELDCLLADFEAVGMETKVSVVGCVKERQEKLIQLKKGKMEML